MEIILEVLIIMLAAYLLAGVAFYFPFIFKGIFQVDPSAKDTGFGFKIIILPGVVALWPLLLNRWINSKGK